jgi:hypothetical protein
VVQGAEVRHFFFSFYYWITGHDEGITGLKAFHRDLQLELRYFDALFLR